MDMLKKYKILIFLCFSVFTVFNGQEVDYTKDIYIIKNFTEEITAENNIIADYFFDLALEKTLNEHKELRVIKNNESLEVTSIKQISNYVNINNASGFFYIMLNKNKSFIIMDISLYNNFGEMLSVNQFILEEETEVETNIEYVDNIYNYMVKCVELLKTKSALLKRFKKIEKNKTKRDFPYINIYLNAVSSKIYFDNRTNSKIFSFFPISLFFSFYPVKYFETGLFVKFDFDDMIYKYYDFTLNDYRYYHTTFNLVYGVFFGGSFFFDIYHYSLGLNLYNIFYYLPDSTEFKKTEDYRSYLLPQISFYQRLDIKIFKIINYSIYFIIKTIPEFFYKDKYFYSEPFKYDFIVIEFSILGFSINL
ncbi:MAG TPA: hypothetical protein PK900_09270 [Spirochaetota bacterium]|nr:hypothetical protein [Spirochaetota bacterium]